MADVGQTAGETFHNTSQEQGSPQAKYSISTQCEEEKIDLIMRYWDYFWTEEGSFLATWGIEGEGFAYDENGNPQYTDLVTQHDLGTRVSLGIYALNDPPTLISQDREEVGYTEITLESGRIWSSNQDGTGYYPTACSMTPEESSEFADTWNDIGVYMTENVPRFILGDLNLESDWDAFVQQLIDMGIEDCIAIWQSTYDRYLTREA